LSDAKEVAALIANLLRHYWTADELPASREAQILDWIEDLVEFGPDIVAAACREWRRRSDGRRPTPGQVRKLAIEERDLRSRPLRLAPPDAERIAQLRAEMAAAKRKKEDEAEAWRRANPGPYGQAVRTDPLVATDPIIGAGPVTGAPPLTTREAIKHVREELAVTGFRLKDVDDPGVQARLREMGVDPAEIKSTPATDSTRAKGSDRRGPAWPRVPHPTPRRARRR
jgi:hypothetical protein